MGTHHSRLYCGNNALNGTGKPHGSRYDCFRVGIGKGRRLPYDPQYTRGYRPIDNKRIYCGNRHDTLAAANANRDPNTPAYAIVGTSPMCLQKGVGVGKSIRAREGRNYVRLIIFISFWALLTASTALILYHTRPSFVTREVNGQQVVNGGLLTLYTSLVSVLSAIVMYIIYRMF